LLNTRSISISIGILLSSAMALASSVTGVVTNRTTGKPAAGDTVTLIKLAQGMQEAGSTTTDSAGRFTIDMPDDGAHLLRVTHDKANYFEAVEPGAKTAAIDVFTAAAKVTGLVEEADVLHMESAPDGKSLEVIETFFVKNNSSPPETQFSDRPFEFYLPPGAVVEGSIALGPGAMSMPVRSAPVPLGDANHYAMVFPLRPCLSKAEAAKDDHCGESRFQVSYSLPYSGSREFTPRPAMPVDTLAILMPKSMAFQPAAAAGYTQAAEETAAQAFLVRNVQPSQPLGFTVSGTGQLPRDTATDGGGAQAAGAGAMGTGADGAGAGSGPGDGSGAGQTQSAAAADTRPGGGLGTPIDPEGENDPWAKYKWWVLGLLGLALAGGAGVMLKSGPQIAVTGAAALPEAPGEIAIVSAAPVAALATASGGPSALLGALKDEMFALETDRLAGRLSEEQYIEQKAALDTVLRRALSRG
jgi:5-hydroxyisourate hydrolase-like protein (transthyretin family)